MTTVRFYFAIALTVLSSGLLHGSYEELAQRVETFEINHYDKENNDGGEHYRDLFKDVDACKHPKRVWQISYLGHCVWDHYIDPICSEPIIKSIELLLSENEQPNALTAELLLKLIEKGEAFTQALEDQRYFGRLDYLRRLITQSEGGKQYLAEKKEMAEAQAREEAAAAKAATEAAEAEEAKRAAENALNSAPASAPLKPVLTNAEKQGLKETQTFWAKRFIALTTLTTALVGLCIFTVLRVEMQRTQKLKSFSQPLKLLI